jgi:hypothetical protein
MVRTKSSEVNLEGYVVIASPATSTMTHSAKHSLEREISPPLRRQKTIREWAYEVSLGVNAECQDWNEFGGLTSVKTCPESIELESSAEGQY